MASPPPIYNIDINQFATFQLAMTLSGSEDFSTPASWSLWSFSGSIAPIFPEEGNQVVEFDIDSGSLGTLAIKLDPSKTALLTEPRYVYDINGIRDLTPYGSVAGNIVYRLLQGKVKVNLGVTETREP